MSAADPPDPLDRMAVLQQRREALLRRSAELRGGLVVGSEAFARPLAGADQLRSLWQLLQRHREPILLGLGTAAALLALRRPRAALRLGWRWARRLLVLRRSWQRTQHWLAPLLARWF